MLKMLIDLLWVPGEVFLIAWIFWLLFVMCMGFYVAWPKLFLAVKVLSAPAVLFAGVFDVVFNFTIASLMFLEFPRIVIMKGMVWYRPKITCDFWTFTARMGAYQAGPSHLKGHFAMILCSHLLDPFQIGGHCKG
jgi:hypothetical protein